MATYKQFIGVEKFTEKQMKKVYACFCTDVIHEGHLNIINKAKEYGELVVGILSDEAMIRYNRFPTIGFEERVALFKNLEGVSEVVIQHDIMYDKIIEEVKPVTTGKKVRKRQSVPMSLKY